ncbi:MULTISPECIES: dicarboxylate/amino acid:cation symporter [unclassified Polaribacter]|jgi:Na+/H+-dicarboxylate symporter|uniref:dicarboxylate/amino acid:cation symporter n=1 Tax=unclassified Polaribacter TaxID=196858 RepID=UPI001C4F1748|nr:MULTISPECIES: dicarboxylate/amino acid:cation symporter [unclassified Polaribacter]QXP67778.1 dicarboxylate/amino acid:cation symporter [Polaribacter sp. AHE13PA]QXP69941.1 dicarboxylate/amino acid:cation symporter [Polaribacter sp. R2A056_3_33]
MKKLALHWKILIGMVLGILFGFIMNSVEGGKGFVTDWIKPFGTIFINLLKLIAVPLILASLIKGISDLKDISKIKKMGIRTMVIYMLTTLVAIIIGLGIVNVVKPGAGMSADTIEKIKVKYETSSDVVDKLTKASAQSNTGPLQSLVDIFPSNIFTSLSDASMLQIIFFALFVGVSLLLIPEKKAKPLMNFFDSLNEVVMKMVDLIMLFAPYAVFALLANVIIAFDDTEILLKLLVYALCVVGGLLLMIGFYLILVSVYTKKSPLWFLKQISPAQLLAFSTSSSAATLPVTMERVEEHLGVDPEVAGFVLPVGATINMDGTSLYQAIAAVFIMQVIWPEGLTFSNQLVIVATALLASIGSAAVPSAGMVMLVIVLESIGFPAELLPIGLALIFAVDRPLDMMRTTVNVTGDATVAMIIAKSLDKLHDDPKPKDWDDNYEDVK